MIPCFTLPEAACPEMKMIPGRAPAWTKTTPYTTMPNSTKALRMPEGEAPIMVVTAVAVRTEGDPTPVPVPEMCKMVVNTRRTEASFTTTCLQTRRLPHPRPQAVLLPRHKGDRMASTFQTGVDSNGFLLHRLSLHRLRFLILCCSPKLSRV